MISDTVLSMTPLYLRFFPPCIWPGTMPEETP